MSELDTLIQLLAKLPGLVALFAPAAGPQVGSVVSAVQAFLPALGVFLTGIGVRNAVVNSLATPAAPASK